MTWINFKGSTDMLKRAKIKSREARRQRSLKPINFQSRDTTPYENQCMKGHTQYCQLLLAGHFDNHNPPPKPKLKKPMAVLFDEWQHSKLTLHKFASQKWSLYGYASTASLYLSMKQSPRYRLNPN